MKRKEPWVIIGDFNATICLSDRRGCASSAKPDLDFQCAIFDCGLHDLGSHGPSFNWYKGQCSVRLDRAFCNNMWLNAFPSSLVLHLLRMKSDHRPIMLNIQGAPSSSPIKPFRYLVGWSLHRDFQRFLQDNWNSTVPISEAIAQFSDDARIWNSEVYGLIGKQKRILMARLRGV
ncbi:hypothetical protein V6N13_091231 [Hibiscus sabdariffa]